MHLVIGMALLATSVTGGVIVKPVANMYSRPSEEADVVSQAICGNNVAILEEQAGWAHVRTADEYTGWTPVSSLRTFGSGERPYASSGRIAQVTSLFANLYREPEVTKHQPLLTAPFETKLEVISEQGAAGRWLEVRLPDNRPAFVQSGDVVLDARPMSIRDTIEFSKRFLGLPYFWGGTSTFGFDCSGFMQMLCRRRGICDSARRERAGDMAGRRSRRSRAPGARRSTVFRRVEGHPHRHVHRQWPVYQRDHARAPGGADQRSRRPVLVKTISRCQENQVKRRDLFKALGSGAVAAPVLAGAPSTIESKVVRLKLRHTWTTVMSSSDYRDTVHLRYTREGITGVGEGAPIVRYHENAEGAQRAIESVQDLLTSADPRQFAKIMAEVFRRVDGQNAAKAAIDIALMDWFGQKLGVPLYTYFGLDAADAPVTTFSIGIDNPEVTRQKVREAAAFPVLKIKVGLATDEPTIEAVRSVTRKPLRVDANEGWKDKEEAVRKINWLESQGVEFIEQPMPAEMIDETRWVRSRVHIPIIADESCLHPADIPKLAGAFDGINVKLDKAGGILEAYRMIQIAKSLHMKTMLGCMVSSSVSVTAAAHLSPLVDYADLDGNLLIANDPYIGVTVRDGKLILPDRPGLGLKPAL